MAKKPKKEKYDEGLVRGKHALLIGFFPVFIFLGTMVLGAWLLVDYYNKITINEDNNDACKLVRKHYPSSIKSGYPCDATDKGTYWLVSYNQNAGASGAPVYISFKVEKSDNAISSALNTN